MKLKQVIDLVDGIEPNGYGYDVKTAWINEIEGMVQTDVMLRAIEDIDQYTWTDDQQTVLLVKPPHDKLYRFYLQAMIQFANGEYDRYSNTMTVFNGAYGEFVRWFSRTVYPAGREAVWRGYYLSSYGIAVAHGYSGTEAEWLASLKGDDGVSPSVATSVIPGGHRVIVTDAQGTQYFDVMNGDGSGDMMSAVYDPVGGVRQVAFADEIPTTAAEVDAIPTSEKGAANGVASLNSGGTVPDGQLPLPWTATKTYAAGDFCEHGGYLWHNTSGAESTGVEPGTNYNVWNVTYSNPNLLDNPWFTVNQRGVTNGQTLTNAYGFDRWECMNKVLLAVDTTDGMTAVGYAKSESCPNPYLRQYIENDWEVGKPYTVSAIVKGCGRFGFGTILIDFDTGNEWQLVSVHATPSNIGWQSYKYIQFSYTGEYGCDFLCRAVKLELGSISTLANDTAPNYAQELAKCQRYFYAFRSPANRNFLFTGAVTTTGGAGQRVWMGIPLPVQMRTNPTVSLVQQGGISIRFGGVTTNFTSSNSTLDANTTTPMQATILLAPNTVPAHWEMYNPAQAYTTGATETVIFIGADL